MNVFVTGGAGFLGLHIATYFRKKKANVVLLDIAPFEQSEYPKGCKFRMGDVRNENDVLSAMKGVDVVIHAAAALPLWKPEEIHDINENGTKVVLEAAQKLKVPRFIFISSTAVYGIPKRHPIVETDPRVGVGPYGESKIKAEEICEEFRKKKMTITVVRPKTFIGTHRLGVFEILFDWVKDGKKIPVIGSGNNRYQLLDVEDLVEALYRISVASDKKKINTEMNIGAATFQTVEQDLGVLFTYAKSGSRVRSTPSFLVKKTLWIFEKLRLSPLYQWVYDTADKDSFVSIDRLTKLLKWKPRYSNAQALIKAYQWYLDHYDEIKSKTPGVTHTAGWKQGILGWFKRFS